MSSILKALEKAEESHSTRRNGGDTGLIRARKHRPTWIMPAAVLSGAAVAALLTFAAMGGFSRQVPVAQAPAVVAKTAAVVVAPLNPVNEVPAALPEQAAPGEPAATFFVPNPKVAPLPALPAVPAVAGKSGRSATVPASHPAAVHSAPVQAAPVHETPVAEAAPASPPAPKGPELKVTGIAWQNNGESSFAVVNGRAVLQGGMVDGFKVLEIHHDMVRFSGSKGTFDLPIGGDESN